jgi:sulfonate transport system permease protein
MIDGSSRSQLPAASVELPRLWQRQSARSLQWLLPWLAPVVLLLLWELSARLGLIAEQTLPSPTAVLRAAVDKAVHGQLALHLGVSALRALAGLLVGGSVGLLLGLATGLSRPLQLTIDGSLQMLRAVPALALVPLVIVWFGLGEGAKLFIVAITVLFPVYLNTFHGVRSVDPQLIEMARVYGLSGFALYREVVFPGALPSILVGLRFALGMSWLVLIVAESLGASEGLGYVAMNAREFMQMDVLVLTIVLWALLGKLADVSARALERRLLPWLPRQVRLDVP